ncbi:MAG TPA: hypothetical protein VFX56_11520 [Nitrospira sp.]|nr:hypothetical protein [Nitrospira sp.]
MPYRFNTIDIAVGVGMCAILFGALLFFAAAGGTYQAAVPQPSFSEHSMGLELGMTLLQPALGQAIADHVLFERRTDRAIARAATDWNQATLAHDEFQSRQGGPLGAVMRQAVTVPADHQTRVQGVMGRAIVNFTARGVRNGLLSADAPLSGYNATMISATLAGGQRLDREFDATWQAVLGRNIVEAVQTHRKQAGAIQERLGSALVQITRVQIGSEEVLAMQQEQLGSLVLAAVRTEELLNRQTPRFAVASLSERTAVASTEPASWPEISMGSLILAGLLLSAIFLAGLSVAVHGREEKAIDQMKQDADRWVYRMAA